MGNQGNNVASFEISACSSPPVPCAELSALKVGEHKVKPLRQIKSSGRVSVVLGQVGMDGLCWCWVEEAGSANPEIKIEIARCFFGKSGPSLLCFNTANLWQNSDCNCLLIEEGEM